MPDLRQIRVLIAVADERSFTRAAERLDIAQPAVSKIVRQLERELGTELLVRTTRAVDLTPAGAALVEDGRALLADAASAFARARAHGSGARGTIAVAATGAVGRATLAEVAARIHDDLPELALELHEIRSTALPGAVREARVDFGLARTFAPQPGFKVLPLRPTPAALAVPPTHSLAGRQAVRITEIDGERLLTWNAPGTPLTDLLVALGAGGGAHVRPVRASVVGVAQLTDLAALDAVAIVPRGWSSTPGVVELPFAEPVDLPLRAVVRALPTTPLLARVLDTIGVRP